MNNNIPTAGETVEMETQHVRNRQVKPNPNVFDDVGLSAEVMAVHTNNSANVSYNFTNITLIGNSTNTNNNDYNESDVLWIVLFPIFMITFCIFGQRANVPSSQYHRGAMIRRQAERVWAIQRVKTERQEIPIETRKTQINESLHKMKIISKCSRTGHCFLGAPEVEEQKETKHEDGEDEDIKGVSTTAGEESISESCGCTGEAASESLKRTKSMNDTSSSVTDDEILSPPLPSTDCVAPIVVDAAAASVSKCDMKCPESPGRTERRPLLSPESEDSEDICGSVEDATEVSQSSANSCIAGDMNSSDNDDFEDDEDVCPICLDNFEVGDIVMWSRHNQGSCSHVFHEECLLQWLLEQRENECPTCRACFIADPATNSTTSSSASTVDTNENSTFGPDETENNFSDEETISNESSGDIEEGNNSSTISNDNNGGDCTFDLDNIKDQKHKIVDGEEEKDSLKTDVINEMEERFSFVIVKGSVQRVIS